LDKVEHEGKYFFLLADSFSQFIAARAYYTDTLMAMGLLTFSNYTKYLSPEIMKGLPMGMYPNVTVYKDSKRVHAFHSMSGGRYTYEESKPLFKWKMSAEKMQIAGYSCQKATTHFAGRDYVAWFTFEIPYRGGPYKFSGLPGFIVQIADTESNFLFKLTSFKQAKWPIFRHKGATEIEKQNYFKKEKDFFENYIKQMQTAGISFPNEEESALKCKNQRVQRSYNPIERVIE
jgi:GLPGLI family protein